MELNPGGVAGVLVLVAVLAAIYLPGKLRERRRHRATVRDFNQYLADDPPGPPATEEQIAAFEARAAELTLPSIQLEAAPGAAEPAGTRVGGPAWLADGEEWPQGRDGRPMEFLAQIDFGALPPLSDFPTKGLLQFFIARDDLFGANLDDPSRSDVRLLWRPKPLVDGSLHEQLPLSELDSTPFDGDVREAGRALRGSPSARRPAGGSLPLEQLADDIGIGNASNLYDFSDPFEDEDEPPHRFVGGHPRFVQWDFRKPGFLDDYDRVLLQLDSSSGLQWGDCGWAVFMIRRADLLARDFSRVAYSWDCS